MTIEKGLSGLFTNFLDFLPVAILVSLLQFTNRCHIYCNKRNNKVHICDTLGSSSSETCVQFNTEYEKNNEQYFKVITNFIVLNYSFYYLVSYDIRFFTIKCLQDHILSTISAPNYL